MATNNFYKSYLKSPAWQRKREQVFSYYGKRCYVCKTYRGPIQVHHLTYERLGRESIHDLRPLCQGCHREVTRLHYRLGKKTPGIVVLNAFIQIKRRKTK